MRHQASVIYHDINSPVIFNGSIDQLLYLRALGDIGLHSNCFAFATRQFFRQRANPVNAAGTQYHDSPLLRQMTRRRLAKPTACSCNDDNFAFDVIAHSYLTSENLGGVRSLVCCK